MSQQARVAVIGAGSWGTTVASLAAANAPTVLWARRDELASEIDEQHANEPYLPGLKLHPARQAIVEYRGDFGPFICLRRLPLGA